MIQVKEFLNYKDIDKEINKWLLENKEIEIVDVKYSVSFAQESKSYDGEAISGALIIYKIKEEWDYNPIKELDKMDW